MASKYGIPVPSSKTTFGRASRLSQTPNLTPNNPTSNNPTPNNPTTAPYYSQPANQNETTTVSECVECHRRCPYCEYSKRPLNSEESDDDIAFLRDFVSPQPEHEGAEQANTTDQATQDFTSAPQQSEAKEEEPVEQVMEQKKTKSQRKKERQKKNKKNAKNNAQQSEVDTSTTRPEQDEILVPDSASSLQPETLTEMENPDEGKVAEENKDAQTENGEDKKEEVEGEDEDDVKVEWSKYVSLRLFTMADADPSLMSMTAAEIEEFHEQGLKHQYDRHFTSHERLLWDNESLPRDLTLKLIRFRQHIKRNAAEALGSEDEDFQGEIQDFERLAYYLNDLRNHAYDVVEEERDREKKDTEEAQDACEYESADEEYQHPDEEDEYRRSRYLPAIGHGNPTSDSTFPPANYNGGSMNGKYDFFGENPAPQVDWSGEAPRSGRNEAEHNSWYGPAPPKEKQTQW